CRTVKSPLRSPTAALMEKSTDIGRGAGSHYAIGRGNKGDAAREAFLYTSHEKFIVAGRDMLVSPISANGIKSISPEREVCGVTHRRLSESGRGRCASYQAGKFDSLH